MELRDAVLGRRSIRAFLDKPLSKDTLTELLDLSRWAPSGMNFQPWRITVAAGEKRDQLADAMAAANADAKPPNLDDLPPLIRARVEPAMAEFRKAAEKDGVSMEQVLAGGARFYDAPVVVVASYDGGMFGAPPPSVAAFVTTLLLAAHDMGLGTCWLGMPLAHADLIKETLGIAETESIVAVVALGYPDLDSAFNEYRSPRDEVETFVRWVGFE